MNKSPKVLVCWAGRPGYIPPPVLSDNQVTIYSHHDRHHPGTVEPARQLAERQDYDLLHAVSQIDDPASFDLVCVSSGANENNQPRNLDAFQCPTVLLVGDTHHVTKNPIRFVMDYLQRERYDRVVSMHNRDHMKWFRQVGDIQPGWFPGLTAQNVPYPFQTERLAEVGFVGSWRVSHPRRKNFINRLRKDQIPFNHQKLSRHASASHYAKSLIAFNCSLNGDLNMRVHEILSAGGFLLTDQLAPQSGLDAILEDGKEFVSFTNYRDFRQKARYFIAHPAEAVEIARNGLERYRQTMQPSQLAQQFLAWAIDGDQVQHNYDDRVGQAAAASMPARLAAYEHAQNKQLWQEGTPVLAVGKLAAQTVSDFDGLVRVRQSVLQTGDVSKPQNYPLVSLDQARSAEWSLVIADAAEQQTIEQLKIAKGGLFFL